MDIQLLVALLLFALAVFFIGKKFYKEIFKKESAGCPDCKVHDGVSLKAKS
jgi:hypothetical protein